MIVKKELARRLGNDVLPTLSSLPWIHSAVQECLARTHFNHERRATAGTLRVGSESPRSVIHFSINKSATQYVKRILTSAAADSGMIDINLSSFASWNDRVPYLDDNTAETRAIAKRAFVSRGAVYTPFGGYVEGIAALGEFRVLLAVRDPRDVLTSEYYSTGYSHPLPGSKKRDDMLSRRATVIETDIDSYVIERAPELRQRFQQYERLLGEPNVLLLQYELLVSDFAEWLSRLLSHTGLHLSEGSKAKLEAERQLSGEGASGKRRQVQPGDHQRKLQPSTIKKLDEVFADTLVTFGYRSGQPDRHR